MLRYHLFAGDTYYPVGGVHDYQGSFSTMAEAAMQHMSHHDWATIAYTQDDGSLEIIWDSMVGFTEAGQAHRAALVVETEAR